MALTTHPDRSWLPMKDISPPTDATEADCSSPITIVAQDYLDDPPVRDLPEPPPAPVIPQDPVCVQTYAPPPNTDISHAIAATASAVASSIPLTQLQRSIDMFCSTLLARTEHTHNQTIQTDRYSLRMIEDLDYIKYQLSANQRPSAREGDQLKEFQEEINQLKLKLDERTTLSQFYTPLSDLHQEICSLKMALANKSPPSPTPVYNKHTPVDTFPSNVLASKECQTSLSVEQKAAASVCIQTSPPVQRTRPRRQFVSPIHASSPLSHSIPTPISLPNRPPLTKLTRIENKLKDIKLTQRQIATKPPPRTHPLHLADIVRQVVDSDGDDVTHRTRKLVSEKLDSIPAMQREQAKKKDSNIQVKNSKTQIRRVKPSDKHEKDPVYNARVYGVKKVSEVKVRAKQSSAEIAGVYKQIESIRTQVQQLATSRPPAVPTLPLRQPTQYHSSRTPVYRAAKLIRPPRLIPSPSSPSQQTPVHVITCDNAQVQTSFLSPVTPAVSTHSPTPLQGYIEFVEVREEHGVDRIVCSSPSLSQLTDIVSQVGEDQLIEQMISLQADEVAVGEKRGVVELPTQLSDPVQLMREQELGRRHLFERVQQLLVQRATESLSDQVRLAQARELQQRQASLTAAVEDVIRRDVIDYIRTAREQLGAQDAERPQSVSPERDTPSELEEDYSLSFASESDEVSECEEQSLNNTLTPHSTFVTPLSPTTPRFVPSPHTQMFPLPLSPHPPLIPLTPEPIISLSSPLFAEVQCDLRDRTPPSSPALSIQTSLSLEPEPEPTPPTLPPSLATQCDINAPSQLDIAVQCDINAPSLLDIAVQCDIQQPLPSPPYLTLPRYQPIRFDIPADDSSSYYLTDVTPSTDNLSNLSEGEYVPRYSRRHRPRPPVDLSPGESSNLSPAVAAALLLKNQIPDISPGEVVLPHAYKTPVRPSTQREEVFTPRISTSINPNPPHFDPAPAPEPATPPNSEDTDSLSRSVTLSLAFSSPSNKTTTRHRDGVDVFDVSSLEGLPVPIGWEHKGDSSLNPAPRQPYHLSDTPHLDKSTNSTTCDVHSIDSVT